MALIFTLIMCFPRTIPKDKFRHLGVCDNDPLPLNNAQELLFALEILLCFLKQTEAANRGMLITNYIEKWSLLLETSSELQKILKVGLLFSLNFRLTPNQYQNNR